MALIYRLVSVKDEDNSRFVESSDVSPDRLDGLRRKVALGPTSIGYGKSGGGWQPDRLIIEVATALEWTELTETVE